MIELSNNQGAEWRTLRSFGLVLQQGHSNDLIPPLEPRTVAVSGRPGAIYFGVNVKERTFEFPLAFEYVRTRSDIQRHADKFVSYLIDSKGKPREIWLRFDYDPGKYYITFAGGPFVIDRSRISFGTFTLVLTAYDPYGRGQSDALDEQHLYDTGLQYDAGLIYPNPEGFAWVYPDQRSSLYNHGQLETSIKITITGSVNSPQLLHETSGKRLYLPAINGRLEIDTGKFTVKHNGVSELSQVGGEWFQMEQGENKLTFFCASANAQVTYEWQHRFL